VAFTVAGRVCFAVPQLKRQFRRTPLQHFGSAKAVSGAGVEDLQVVGGISAAMAQLIYDFFHERRG
jgi:excinuclease ABC subunit C